MTKTASNCDLQNTSSDLCETIWEYTTQGSPLQVPSARKKSDVGEIPTEWEVKSIGQLGKITTGPFGTLLKASEYSASDGVPLISVGEVGAGCFSVSEKTPRVPPEVVRRLPQYVLRKGDIVFGRKGAVERSAQVTDAEDGWFLGSDGISIRPAKSCFAPYLAWQLQRSEVQSWLLQNAVGTTMASLNQGVLSRVRIPIATDSEQRAIAEALSDVDGLLRSLDAVIAKKRAIRQAAMQQLLTGKARLPGFSRPWETRRLGDHVTFLRNGTNPRADLSVEGHVKYLHYGDIHTAFQVRLNAGVEQMPFLPAERVGSMDRLRDGDLVFVDASEDIDGVGKSIEISGATGHEVVPGLHTIAARFDSSVLAEGYRAFLQFCPAFRVHLRRLAAGTKVYATTRAHIASAEIPLPPLLEQRAIAAVLHELDDEIMALSHRRKKTYAIKQGMMQQLLTGRVRLVPPSTGMTKAATP